jgi:hypothetical protein
MDPLLGLLGASAVTAIVGTALKGIVRPLSWAMLAAAALLFGSSKVVEATNALIGDAATSPSVSPSASPTISPSLSPNSTQTPASNSAIASPAAAQGWQGAASSLNPALSSLYTQSQPGQTPNPSPPLISGSNTSTQNPAPPPRVSSQPSPPPSPPPVIGYW